MFLVNLVDQMTDYRYKSFIIFGRELPTYLPTSPYFNLSLWSFSMELGCYVFALPNRHQLQIIVNI